MKPGRTQKNKQMNKGVSFQRYYGAGEYNGVI